MRFTISVKSFLMFEKYLDSLNKFLGNGVQKGILGFDLKRYQKFNHFEILIVDGHQKSGSSERIDAIHVNPVGFLGTLERPEVREDKKAKKGRKNNGQ